MRLLNIGYGNSVSAARVIAVVTADSAPARRTVQDAREEKRLIDGTAGHKGACVLVMDNGCRPKPWPPGCKTNTKEKSRNERGS